MELQTLYQTFSHVTKEIYSFHIRSIKQTTIIGKMVRLLATFYYVTDEAEAWYFLPISWSFELAIVCPEPPTVPNATPKKTFPSPGSAGNVPGTTFSYTCLDGHEMIGAATLTCLSSKSWDNPQPSCSLIGNLFLYVWFYFDKTALAKSALMPLSRFAALFSLSNDRFLI